MLTLDDKCPIFILGAARSGTTLLAENILAHHEDLHYWAEPNYVWRAFSPYRPDDLIGVNEVGDSYKAFICRFFERASDLQQGKRVLEKTPANCLRGPVLKKVYPNAKFIHVIRDGRAVCQSAMLEWTAEPSSSLDSREIRERRLLSRIWGLFQSESSLRQRLTHWRFLVAFPFYFARFMQVVIRQLFKPTFVLWGPRVPGLVAIRRSLGLRSAVAYQWMFCTESAKAFGATLTQENFLEIHFEELTENPDQTIREILRFCNLRQFDDRVLEQICATIKPQRKTFSSDFTFLSPDNPLTYGMEALLRELGYLSDKSEGNSLTT